MRQRCEEEEEEEDVDDDDDDDDHEEEEEEEQQQQQQQKKNLRRKVEKAEVSRDNGFATVAFPGEGDTKFSLDISLLG